MNFLRHKENRFTFFLLRKRQRKVKKKKSEDSSKGVSLQPHSQSYPIEILASTVSSSPEKSQLVPVIEKVMQDPHPRAVQTNVKEPKKFVYGYEDLLVGSRVLRLY